MQECISKGGGGGWGGGRGITMFLGVRAGVCVRGQAVSLVCMNDFSLWYDEWLNEEMR